MAVFGGRWSRAAMLLTAPAALSCSSAMMISGFGTIGFGYQHYHRFGQARRGDTVRQLTGRRWSGSFRRTIRDACARPSATERRPTGGPASGRLLSRSAALPAGRPLLPERERALPRVLRGTHRLADLALPGELLLARPVRRLHDDPFGGRHGERAVGRDGPGQPGRLRRRGAGGYQPVD